MFVTDNQEESTEQRMFVIDALETDPQRRMRQVKSDGILPNSICFFGSNYFLLTRTEEANDEQNSFLECRKLHSIV